jgi:hypothetical protein
MGRPRPEGPKRGPPPTPGARPRPSPARSAPTRDRGCGGSFGGVPARGAPAAGHPLGDAAWQRLAAMTDSCAALVDERLRPPRQGDGDEGRGLLLDAPAANRWPSLLALGAQAFGPLPWWPPVEPDAGSTLAGALAGAPRAAAGRPAQRPSHFADAGTTVLRTTTELPESSDLPEIWCRCDGGPHGFLSIAAHAHADALAVEVRYGGVDILADPGTYCYHGDPPWRSYFRSTLAHNTVELAGQSQSADGGPFLWLRHANSRELDVADGGEAASWSAEHDGYRPLDPPARHRRRVVLDRQARTLEIADEIEGAGHQIRLAFHLGPEVAAHLEAPVPGAAEAVLQWPDAVTPGAARLALPAGLAWTLHRGETDPILGWYADGLGRRRPSWTLLGTGVSAGTDTLVTRLEFHDAGLAAKRPITWSDVSLGATDAQAGATSDMQAEAG